MTFQMQQKVTVKVGFKEIDGHVIGFPRRGYVKVAYGSTSREFPESAVRPA